jgi:hypothetical protein
MSADRPKDYGVGYAKPPEKTRFQKGISGNPGGRAKGSKNVSKLLLDALSEPVIVNENGQRKQITKAEAMIKQLVNKGASGDARSIQLLMAEMRSRLESDGSDDERSETTKEQLLMLERLTVAERIELRRLVAKAQGSSDPRDIGTEEIDRHSEEQRRKDGLHK